MCSALIFPTPYPLLQKVKTLKFKSPSSVKYRREMYSLCAMSSMLMMIFYLNILSTRFSRLYQVLDMCADSLSIWRPSVWHVYMAYVETCLSRHIEDGSVRRCSDINWHSPNFPTHIHSLFINVAFSSKWNSRVVPKKGKAKLKSHLEPFKRLQTSIFFQPCRVCSSVLSFLTCHV